MARNNVDGWSTASQVFGQLFVRRVIERCQVYRSCGRIRSYRIPDYVTQKSHNRTARIRAFCSNVDELQHGLTIRQQ
jgi:hypothetical protein